MATKFTVPTTFVIFGITGDLFKKKILEGIHTLYKKDLLPPKTFIYGFGRREWSDDDLQKYIVKIAEEENLKISEDFLKLFHFVKGNYENIQGYKDLAEQIGIKDKEVKFCTNKLFYLATPPELYFGIIEKLKESKLTKPCGPDEGWTRVILEKPFGTDLETAVELDKVLSKTFKEEQIYRVDHYLAKETTRNILAFRFSNRSLTASLNKTNIKKIEVRILEKANVLTRGDFYDKVGALRDVGQNHALQLLALFTMDSPKTFRSIDIRKERGKIFKALTKSNYTKSARAQYEEFNKIVGVKADSHTETYFKLETKLKTGKFAEVPILIEGGKGMAKDETEIKIIYKEPKPFLCTAEQEVSNVLTYKIKPKEEITISLLVKKPGYDFEVSKQELKFKYLKKGRNNIKDYEQLLMDIVRGDQTLFVSTEEIMNQWKFVDPILKRWRENKKDLVKYKIGEKPQVEYE